MRINNEEISFISDLFLLFIAQSLVMGVLIPSYQYIATQMSVDYSHKVLMLINKS